NIQPSRTTLLGRSRSVEIQASREIATAVQLLDTIWDLTRGLVRSGLRIRSKRVTLGCGNRSPMTTMLVKGETAMAAVLKRSPLWSTVATVCSGHMTNAMKATRLAFTLLALGGCSQQSARSPFIAINAASHPSHTVRSAVKKTSIGCAPHRWASCLAQQS